jgi:hypothetical protein
MSTIFYVYEFEDDESLKEFGGIWDKMARRWIFPKSVENKVIEYLKFIESDSEDEYLSFSEESTQEDDDHEIHNKGFHRERSFDSQCSL